MAYIYKEEELIKQFVPWFVAARTYDQQFEDIDTSGGDPVDSAGFIDNQVVLIEFKHTLRRSEVWYKGSSGSSIEKKIRTVLDNLYSGKRDRVTRSLTDWDKESEPLFILVANSLSVIVLDKLKDMLALRSRQWCFGYEVIVWQGSQGATVMASKPRKVLPDTLSAIVFPDMPSTAPARASSLSIDVCLKALEKAGIGEIGCALMNELKGAGAKRKGYSKNNINFYFPPSEDALIGIWPSESSQERGLLITYWLEGLGKMSSLDLTEENIPGIPGPRKGHLGASTYIRSAEELNNFIGLLDLK